MKPEKEELQKAKLVMVHFSCCRGGGHYTARSIESWIDSKGKRRAAPKINSWKTKQYLALVTKNKTESHGYLLAPFCDNGICEKIPAGGFMRHKA